MANLLRHERFERPPVALPKRRGRLPRGIVSIKAVPRLKVGVLAEVFDQERPEDNGKRVVITGFDPSNSDGYHFECESLDGPIQCEGGKFASLIWFKPEELRRLWTGNTTPSKAGVL